MDSIETLNKSLRFDNAGKGLENVNTAISRCNFSPLNSAIDTVGVKFNALYTIADQALRNITNSAYNAGKNILSALTIEPVRSGLSEYETQINSVQTILANTESKGSTLNDVNAALDELNQYADKTIYNFTEMTNNIGRFTAAGVDLETSVNAIQGIANLAAVSGSTSQQASTAMYQLSQALAAGKVSLMDWNSVVNAGMGGELFQNALIRTSELLKTGAKDAIATYGSFRESLTKGEWLTTEVLTETLKQLAGAYTEAELVSQGYTKEQAAEISKLANTASDAATKVKTATQLWDTLKEAAQSGWTQTWEILIGDFEEARNMWTSVSDTLNKIIGDSAERRNNLLSGALDTNWEKFVKGVNAAGIETEKFEEKVKSLAEAKGIDIYALMEEHGSLEKIFRSGAVSSDILKEAINGLNGSLKETQEYTVQSGDSLWKIAQKYGTTIDEIAKLNNIEDLNVIFEGQVLKLNGALDETGESIEGVSEETLGLIDKLGELGGRELLIQSLANIFNGLKSAIAPVGEAFREIFPAIKPEQIYDVIKQFHALTENFKLNDTQASQVKTTFMGLFSVIRTGGEFIFAVVSGVAKLLGNLKGLGNGILGVTSSFGEYLLGLRTTIKETDVFNTAVDKVVGFIQKIIDKVKGLAGALKAEFKMPGLEGFLGLLGGIWNIIKKVGSTIVEMGVIIGEALTHVFRTGDLAAGLDVVNSGIFATILLGVKKFINGLTESLDVKGGFIESITALRDSVLDTFKSFQEQLKAETLKKIAVAIAILAASILVLSMIDPVKMTFALSAIGGLFIDLMVAMKAMTALGDAPKGLMRTAHLMVSMSAAILLLAAAMKVISTMTWEEMARGLTGVFGLTAIMVAAGRVMSSNSKQVIKGAGQMVIAAGAMLIFASVCKKMSELSWEQLAKGMVGVGSILLEFVGFQTLMSLIKPKKLLSSATSLVIIGAAMEIFADVCGKFGEIGWEALGKSGAAMSGILALAAGFSLLSGLSKKLTRSSVALVIIAASMEIFTDVCSKFGTLKWEELGKAGAAMGGILALAAGFTLLSGLSKKMGSSVVSLVIIAAAMEIFTDICQKFSVMKWEELAKAGAAIGGILLLVAGFALLAGLSHGILASSAALLIMATSLAILAPIIKELGSMPGGEIAKALITIAGAFAIIGVAGLVLSPIIPTILALSGAIALLGIACATIGAGVWLFSSGLAALAVAGTAGATAIVASMSIIITGIVGLIPVIAQKIGEAVVVFAQTIAEMAPALGNAVKALVLTLVDVLVECVPAIADGALKLLVGVLKALVDYGPELVNLIFDFMIRILEGFSERIPDLIQAAVNVMMSFFAGIIDAIKMIDIATLTKGIAGVALISAIMLALAGMALITPLAMVGVLGIAAVIAELAIVLAAIGALAQIPGLEWLVNESGNFLTALGNAIGGFVGGIVGGVMEGITSSLPQIATDLSMFMTNLAPFIAGAKTIDATMLDSVKTLAEIILILTGANIIEGLTSWLTGGSSLSNFAKELVPFGEAMAAFSATIDGKINEAAITAAANAGRIIAEMASILPNTGGVVSWFTGDNNMSAFFDQLVPFGKAMVNFSTTVDGKINESAVTAAANAGRVIAEMATSLPNTGGVVGWFTGDNDMTAFAKQLIPFGKAIADFSATVDGKVNEGAVTAATNAGKMVAEMASSLPNSGGVIGWFTGENDMSGFSKNLVSFGRAMSDFAESVSSIATENISGAVAQINQLIALVKGMGGIDFSVIGSFEASLSKIGKTGVTGFIKAFDDAKPRVTAAAKLMMMQLIAGFKNSTSQLASVARAIGVGAATSLKNAYTSFHSAGAHLAQGFANGISENAYKAAAKAKAMAEAAVEAARNALDINSPSKVFMKLGSSIPEGFAKGISDFGSSIGGSSVAMARTAIDGTKNAIARVTELMNSDIDSQPTIRPVLDLSDVKSGAKTINGMFGMQPSLELLTNVGSINSMMNTRQNGVNTTNDDVVAAIKDLKTAITESSGDSYSINGITYDDGSNIANTIKSLVRASRIEGRI
jgi:LysM repeat protein